MLAREEVIIRGGLVVPAGAGGALLEGWSADRIGRTLVTGVAMAVSACCALKIGLTLGGPQAGLTVVVAPLGWRYAFAVPAIGSLPGMVAMAALRCASDARRLAGGRL